MKDWRERGCVQDSDEEEILDIDSQTSLLETDKALCGRSFNGLGSQELGDGEVQATDGQHTRLEESDKLGCVEQCPLSSAGPAAPPSSLPSVSQLDDNQRRPWTGSDRKDGSRSNATNLSALEHAAPQQVSGQDITVTKITSTDSSPLSSPGSSDSEDIRPRRPSPLIVLSSSVAPSRPPHITTDDIDNPDGGNNDFVADRRFRSRKPIQLHPYMVEREVYKKSWQARGMVPVRLLESQMEAPARSRNTHEETQDAWEPESSPVSAEIGVDSAPSSPRGVFAPLSEQGSPEEEFPDVDRIMHRNVPGQMQPTFKRRRLTDIPLASKVPDTSERLEDTNSVMDSTQPPTPPATDSAASSSDLPTAQSIKFRLPKGLERSGLVTPDISSPRRLIVEDDHMPTVDAEIVDVDTLSHADTPSSVSETEDEPDFSRVRRRIKGVLPASWLRLDSKAQKPQSPKRVSSTLLRSVSGNAVPLKGVAQRRLVNSSTPGRSDHARPDLTFESEESERESPTDASLPLHSTFGHGKRDKLRQTRIDTGATSPISVDSDDMERNDIDLMLPSGTARRRNKTYAAKVKRQTQLTDTFQQSLSTKSRDRSSAAGRTRDRRADDGRREIKKTLRMRPRSGRPPLLSIADVQPEPNLAAPMPQFVRLANRAARQRTNHGRHSPSRKVLRLATAADTAEAMTTLTSWYKGGLQRSGRDSSCPLAARPHSAVEANDDLSRAREMHSRSTDEFVPLRRLSKGRPSQTRRWPISATQPHRQRGLTSRPPFAPTVVSQTNPQIQPLFTGEGPVPSRSRLPESLSRRTMQTTPGTRDLFRAGQLEMNAREFDLGGQRVSHLYKVNYLQQLLIRGQRSPKYSLPLERFLKSPPESPSPSVTDYQADDPSVQQQTNRSTKVVRQKARARRLDTETAAYRQPSEPLLITSPEATEPAVSVLDHGLRGLGPYGTKYSTDFDVHPLQPGTYFHESTFIGSGDFERVMLLKDRNLDEIAGHITITVGDRNLRWSAWNEDVANGLTQVLNVSRDAFSLIKDMSKDNQASPLVQSAGESVLYLLRSITRYFSNCICFSDPVDRESCLTKCLVFVQEFIDELNDIRVDSDDAPCSDVSSLILEIYLYLFCISHQLLIVSRSSSAPTQFVEKALNRFSFLGRQCFDLTLRTGCHDLRALYEDMRHHEKRERGIRDDRVTAYAVVVLHYLRSGHMHNEPNFAESAYDLLTSSVNEMFKIRHLDQAWYDIFTLQPILEVDVRGIYRPGTSSTTKNEHWPAVKILLDRIFTLYPGTVETLNPTVNDYIRSNLIRVRTLIGRWHWTGCEIALSSIYDFFAKRGLGHLSGEEGRGSPKFLEQAHQEPRLDFSIRETTFHIFLKLLGTGLSRIPEQYPSTKVKRIVWRFVPNHGRTYRKDEDVQQTDLDALQNHHDLLCTLVWALPPGSRPRLDGIRDLVDLHTSHQEACRINVNAWKISARIVVSRKDQNEDTESLASWFRDIVSAMSQQYRLARAEAEQIQEMAPLRSLGQISFDQVQMVVSKNQRKILDTLLLAIAGMQGVIKTVQSQEIARHLLEQSNALDIFKIFDAKQTRTYGPVLQTLVLCREYLAVDKRLKVNATSDRQESSEESQDYGDFDGFDDILLVDATSITSRPLDGDEFLRTAVSQLLSNVFGADTIIDDGLLACLIEVWTSIAAQNVAGSTKRWHQYLGFHTPESWFSLRYTDHLRKWTPFALAKILDLDPVSFKENKDVFLGTWLVSLVERESMLKFQHIYTAAILNASDDEELVANLPFARDRDVGRFTITLNELRAARISLIGSILSNMRTTYERASGNESELRSRYTHMLKQCMTAMKTTYQEVTQQTTAVADAHARGNYITFVQQIISIMQQHTLDICAIDRFFTDSAAFPLPTNDPEYVIGRIKKHEPRLGEEKGRKQLAFFLQTRSQASAINNESNVLADQVFAAIHTAGRTSPVPRPSLYEVFHAAFLPAYIQVAREQEAGLILAAPMLQASALALDERLYSINLDDPVVAEAELHLLDIVLSNLVSLVPANPESNILTLRTTAVVFRTALPTIRITDLAQRIHPSLPHSKALEHLFSSARSIHKTLTTRHISAAPVDEEHLPLPPTVQPIPPAPTTTTTTSNPFESTLSFIKQNLTDEVNRHWRKDGEEWVVTTGGRITRISRGFGSYPSEKKAAVDAVEAFVCCFENMFGLRRDLVRQGVSGQEKDLVTILL